MAKFETWVALGSLTSWNLVRSSDSIFLQFLD